MKRLLVVLLLIFGASTAYADVYTWKDNRGTDHFTNSLDEIPARYLKKARVWDVATGKKGKLVTASPAGGQAAGPAAPAAAAAAPAAPAANPSEPAAAPAPPQPPPAPASAPPAVSAPAQPLQQQASPPARRHRPPRASNLHLEE